MKICFLSSFYGTVTGGAEVSISLLAEGLIKEGLDVKILTTRKTRRSQSFTIPLSSFPRKLLVLGIRSLDYWLAYNIIRILKKDVPDIIHAHDIYITPAASIVARKLKIPLIVTVRDGMLPRIKIGNEQLACYIPSCPKKDKTLIDCDFRKFLICYLKSLRDHHFIESFVAVFRLLRHKSINKALMEADRIVAVSKFIKRELIELGVEEERIITIYNPAPNWEKIKIRRNNKKIVLFAGGRITKEKGFNILIKALKLVVRKYKNVELRLAGDGPFLKELKKIVMAEGLKEYVEFIGKISYRNMMQEFFNSDIVIFPSTHPEPFGRIPIEAMVCEKPVIASKIGGIPEVVEDGISGLLVPPSDAEELSEAIVKLIENEELREKMGIEGRRIAREKFNIENIAKQHVELYQKVIINRHY
jgi:glycosyltransferase involved in cell wall biosynthesis